MPINGTIGAVYKESGPSAAFTGAATTKDAAYKVYTISDLTKRFLDPTAAITVKKNGTTVASGYTVEPFGGIVTFTAANLVSDVITVDGKAIPTTEIANLFNWSLDLDVDIKDATTFSSNGWAEKVVLNKSWAGSVEGYYSDASFAGLVGTELIFVLYVDDVTNKRYEGKIILKKNGIKAPSDDLVKENVDLEGNGILYYRE